MDRSMLRCAALVTGLPHLKNGLLPTSYASFGEIMQISSCSSGAIYNRLGSRQGDGMEKKTMKRFLLATVGSVALLGMAAPALAADMAVKAPPPAPLPMIYNWSGFYVGANGGWGQSHNCVDFFNAAGTDFARLR